MTRKFAALATVATLTLTGMAPAVSAMDMEFNMLTGAIFNELRSRNLPTENIDKLSLGQIAIIRGILNNDDNAGKQSQDIAAILRRVEN